MATTTFFLRATASDLGGAGQFTISITGMASDATKSQGSLTSSFASVH